MGYKFLILSKLPYWALWKVIHLTVHCNLFRINWILCNTWIASLYILVCVRVRAVASSLFPIMLYNLQASSYEDSTASINGPQFINSHSKTAKQSTMQACQWKQNAILWHLFLFKLLGLSSLTRLQVLGSLCYSGSSQCNDKPSFTSQDSIVWNLLAFIYLSFDLNGSWIVNVQMKMNT